MKEEFLHFLWKYQLFSKKQLQTQNKESVKVLFNGNLNRLEGPDFLNAKIEINQQVWVGNIEIHLKSSDWYLHQHEKDKNYDAVILHVVWENDAEVFGKNNVPLPTLELKELVSKHILSQYDALLYSKQSWIPCENQIKSVDYFTMKQWQERLFIERLESKSTQINSLLQQLGNDWEAVLFRLMAKNFGLKVNSETFLQWSQSFSFSVLKKERADIHTLSALFFGQANLLNNEIENAYYKHLQNEYKYLQYKHQLKKP